MVAATKKYHSVSNYFLLAMIFVFSLNILQYYVADTGIISSNLFYEVLYTPIASLSVAFMYFYIFKFLFPEEPISTKSKFLYLPFVVFFCISVFFKFYFLNHSLEEKSIFTKLFWRFEFSHEVLSIFFTLFVIFLCFKLIRKYQKTENKDQYHRPKMEIFWLKMTLTFLLVIITISWIYFTYLDFFVGEPTYYFLWIGMSAAIYWLGHLGIYKFGIQKERDKIRAFTNNQMAETIAKPEILRKSKQLEFFEAFVVNEKNFLDPLLSLEKTAEELNINKSYLSRVLNQELNISFNDYINELRVEEAKKIINQPEFEQYTLSSIGLEAGFNSKTTFYSAFKKFVGCTPSEYKKSLSKIKAAQETQNG